MYRASSERELL